MTPEYIRVTIGMPVYNGAEFLETALAALRAQTFTNFALVISDNASTDGTSEILQEWAAGDDRVALHRQETNIGAAANFRFVLDQAGTEYFMWYAHDDWLAPDYLEELVSRLDAKPDCALACPTVDRVAADGTLVRQVTFPSALPADRLDRVKFLLRQPEPAWIYGLFRAETLRRVQALTASFGWVWAADHVAILWFILNDRICGTDRTTFYSRKLGLSASRYGPSTHAARWRFVSRYFWFHARIWTGSPLPWVEKATCLPSVISHAFATSYRKPLRTLAKKPIKAALRSLAGRGADASK